MLRSVSPAHVLGKIKEGQARSVDDSPLRKASNSLAYTTVGAAIEVLREHGFVVAKDTEELPGPLFEVLSAWAAAQHHAQVEVLGVRAAFPVLARRLDEAVSSIDHGE